MFNQSQIEEIVDLLLTLSPDTKVYLGCDSVRFNRGGRWYARYATVAIVHMNGKHGCRIFNNISVEPDYDLKKNRPKVRMMNEVINLLIKNKRWVAIDAETLFEPWTGAF